MGVWDWALKVYERPGVPEACLALQDYYSQNVAYLLWAAWAGTRDPERLAPAAEAARAWDQAALTPLREARRGLKASQPPVADGARERLRAEVIACERAAERLLLETLADLSGKAPARDSVLEVLEAASEAWGAPAPRHALAALADALE